MPPTLLAGVLKLLRKIGDKISLSISEEEIVFCAEGTIVEAKVHPIKQTLPELLGPIPTRTRKWPWY